MLDFASPGQIPEQPAGSFQPTDVDSFEQLVDAGGDVLMQCVRARGVGILPDLRFGWMRAGESSLWINTGCRFGVDFFPTDSCSGI